jgi:hypothetical protein
MGLPPKSLAADAHDQAPPTKPRPRKRRGARGEVRARSVSLEEGSAAVRSQALTNTTPLMPTSDEVTSKTRDCDWEDATIVGVCRFSVPKYALNEAHVRTCSNGQFPETGGCIASGSGRPLLDQQSLRDGISSDRLGFHG